MDEGSRVQLTGIVLAGGQSRRLGQDKRRLLLDGAPLLARVLDVLRPLVDEVLLVGPDADALRGWDARVVTDRYPGYGVLAGLHAGLEEAHGAWAFALAADLPFLNADLLTALAALALTSEADVVIPRWQGALEPLHALYRPAACAPAARAALQRGERRIISFFPDVRVHVVEEAELLRWDPAGRSFFNINTADDWDQALRWVAAHNKRSG